MVAPLAGHRSRGPSSFSALAVGAGASLSKALAGSATLDFPSVGIGLTADLTIAVTGALANDFVVVAPPAATVAGLEFFGFVSAANVVTVRAINNTAAAIDPASGTYKVLVLRVA